LATPTTLSPLEMVNNSSISPHPITLLQRMWKQFLPRFGPQYDSNHERTTRLIPTRAMATLTCELWHEWCSVTFSALWSHHCEGSEKNSRHSFSLWPPGTAETLPFKSCIFYHIEATMRYCVLNRMCPIFRFDSEDTRSTFFGKRPTSTVRRRQKTDTQRGTNKKAYNCRDLWVQPLFLSSGLWEELRCIAKVVDG
jgi:hypothetical protein